MFAQTHNYNVLHAYTLTISRLVLGTRLLTCGQPWGVGLTRPLKPLGWWPPFLISTVRK